MSTKELLSCPFCGGPATLALTSDSSLCECYRCEVGYTVFGTDFTDQRRAMDLWNHRARTAQPWHPIETALNGEALVWVPNWGHLVAEFADGIWRDDEGNTLSDEVNRGMPTHWMPLPIAPASSGEAK